jgi:hypothetical protein
MKEYDYEEKIEKLRKHIIEEKIKDFTRMEIQTLLGVSKGQCYTIMSKLVNKYPSEFELSKDVNLGYLLLNKDPLAKPNPRPRFRRGEKIYESWELEEVMSQRLAQEKEDTRFSLKPLFSDSIEEREKRKKNESEE